MVEASSMSLSSGDGIEVSVEGQSLVEKLREVNSSSRLTVCGGSTPRALLLSVG